MFASSAVTVTVCVSLKNKPKVIALMSLFQEFVPSVISTVGAVTSATPSTVTATFSLMSEIVYSPSASSTAVPFTFTAKLSVIEYPSASLKVSFALPFQSVSFLSTDSS